MSLITYDHKNDKTHVHLDGKTVGTIVSHDKGFRYLPGGKVKYAGETYPTLDACKESLLEDSE